MTIPALGVRSTHGFLKHRVPPILALLVAVAAPTANAATACETSSNSCAGGHSGVFAVAHDYNDYANTILYRVSVPKQPTGTAWGDGDLVIYSSGKPRWASGTADGEHGGNDGRRLAFNGPCEVVILKADNAVLWSTKTSCD